MNNAVQLDFFGNAIEQRPVLRDTFIEPPFTIIDTKTGKWQARKRKWIGLGIKGEYGRKATAIHGGTDDYRAIKNKEGYNNRNEYTSVFDPSLCEVIYKWFCPDGGKILDPFAGGAVRGIVANTLGYKYTGIDIREEQIEANERQGAEITPENIPTWYCGDSNKVLDTLNEEYDFVFSCPPYVNLEVYSDIDGDISNMSYEDFKIAYSSIIRKTCSKLKKDCLAAFVVGEVRGKDGGYLGFVPYTIKAFTDCGMQYYNEAIIETPIASGSMRAAGNMKTKKLVKTHQNLLVFKKI